VHNQGHVLELTAAIGNYRHVAALKDGSVTIQGARLRPVDIPNYVDIFRNMARSLEYDVSLMSMISYLCAKDHGLAFSAIPIVVNAGFHHDDFLVNSNTSIQTPKDLEGKRVGTRTYTVTPGTLDRGILSDEFGVDLDSITWVLAEQEHVVQCQSHLPPNVIPGIGEDLFPRLASGDLDAGIAGSNLRGSESPNVRRLFPNGVELDRAYYERTGIIQPFQIIVVKDDLLAQHAWLAEALYTAFKAAKLAAHLETEPRLKAVIGGADPLPYGLSANRRGFSEAIRLASEQHMIARQFTLEELFPSFD
jgi:4,5-dihydroxyphthalate decarboxylase